jgi:hypothetical protein
VKRKKAAAAVHKPAPAGPRFVVDPVRVPLPERPKRERAYFPFDVLEVGQSFTSSHAHGTLRDAQKKFRANGGSDRSFAVRELPEGGCRVWRVK